MTIYLKVSLNFVKSNTAPCKCSPCKVNLFYFEQEFIPVGCVRPAAVVVRGEVWSWSPWICPLGVDLDLIPLNLLIGCGPESDPPQVPPWVWAWGGGRESSPDPQEQTPAGADPSRSRSPAKQTPQSRPPWERTPTLWTEFLTHAYENISLPQTSFAGNKKDFLIRQ